MLLIPISSIFLVTTCALFFFFYPVMYLGYPMLSLILIFFSIILNLFHYVMCLGLWSCCSHIGEINVRTRIFIGMLNIINGGFWSFFPFQGLDPHVTQKLSRRCLNNWRPWWKSGRNLRQVYKHCFFILQGLDTIKHCIWGKHCHV